MRLLFLQSAMESYKKENISQKGNGEENISYRILGGVNKKARQGDKEGK